MIEEAANWSRWKSCDGKVHMERFWILVRLAGAKFLFLSHELQRAGVETKTNF